MKPVLSFLLCFLILFTSCVSMKQYKADQLALTAVKKPQDYKKEMEHLEKEIAALKEKVHQLNKLQSEIHLLEKKIADLQKAPEKTEQIKKNQKSTYLP